jgi:GNAT superfamily N-acetyltransferase
MNEAEYIHSRIEKREIYGAFINGKLAGFAGTHTDGSIGMLEVLPEYRRRGLGSELESFLINLHLSKSYTPFCQIFSDNAVSLGLQRKLGLQISGEHLYWLF